MLQARRLVLPGCMRKLPPSDRELIEQRYLDSNTVVEIARQSGRSANTLYKALERIRHALLKCIEETLSKKH
jgi:RNA polymerase sigma-70 factor (ECF subfamily)